MALKYRFNLKDIKLEDFRLYLFSLFKAFIPKKKIKNIDLSTQWKLDADDIIGDETKTHISASTTELNILQGGEVSASFGTTTTIGSPIGQQYKDYWGCL